MIKPLISSIDNGLVRELLPSFGREGTIKSLAAMTSITSQIKRGYEKLFQPPLYTTIPHQYEDPEFYFSISSQWFGYREI